MNENFKVDFEKNDDVLTIKPSGRLDTFTSPELGRLLEGRLEDIRHVVVDFSHVDYLSSAGLRILLITQQEMEKKDGSMKVVNLSKNIRDILEMTGFLDFVETE